MIQLAKISAPKMKLHPKSWTQNHQQIKIREIKYQTLCAK